MRNGPLLVAASTLGLAGVVLLTIVAYGPTSSSGDPNVLLGKKVRYMQARSLVGEPSMLHQDQKAAAMDSLEDGLQKGLYTDMFKTPKSTKLCEGRGCTFDNAVAFECGGKSEANQCLSSVQACVDHSEATIAKYYAKDKQRAREARPAHLCKCFVSNGCEPACNVAMYMVWATGSGVTCNARPPSFVDSAGAFQYGDPLAKSVMPTDISYDYFPEYPSPAGRQLGVEDMRRLYHSDDATPQTLPPYHPWHWGRYEYPAAENYYHPFSYYSPFYSIPHRPYSYSPTYPWYWNVHPSSYNPYKNYYDPYFWYNYYYGYDTADRYVDKADDYADQADAYSYPNSGSSYPAWEQFGDYYYDPATGHVIMSQ